MVTIACFPGLVVSLRREVRCYEKELAEREKGIEGKEEGTGGKKAWKEIRPVRNSRGRCSYLASGIEDPCRLRISISESPLIANRGEQ